MFDLASFIPHWLDALLIAPFRWPTSPELGMWVGSVLIAIYCTLIGICISKVLYKIHGRYYGGLQDDTKHYHDVSMRALTSGNKEAYLAANTLAHEHFGKSFFARASVSMASLLPVPFALGWMSIRFEGIVIYTIPYTSYAAGYVFVLLTSYILCRIFLPKIYRFLTASNSEK